ncbi:MAG TPA: hypothetical protein VJM46_00460 [Candidatus Saccharimonadales bacterium]|nr:hypothetical protein [Candidatus Saccharimonadales bacterium]
MSLTTGKIHGGAIVIGGYGWGSMAEPTEAEQLQAVVAQVRAQFSLAVRLGARQITGPLPHGRRSSAITAGAHGLVARIKNGAGVAIVSGLDRLGVDYGQWVYVLPGRQVTFEGTVISGMNLNVMYAQLAQS